MKEYHKAMQSYDDGLKLDAGNDELTKAKNKTIMAIQSGMGSGGEGDEERARHAM